MMPNYIFIFFRSLRHLSRKTVNVAENYLNMSNIVLSCLLILLLIANAKGTFLCRLGLLAPSSKDADPHLTTVAAWYPICFFAGSTGTERTRELPKRLSSIGTPIQRVQVADGDSAIHTEKEGRRSIGRGDDRRKSSRGKAGRHCTNCSFTVKYESIDGFQVLNGQIYQYQHARPRHDASSAIPQDLAICDNQKCTSSSRISHDTYKNSPVTTVVTSVEGQCDNKDKRIGHDYLEVNFFAQNGGQVNILCPDVNYVVDVVCDAFQISTGSHKPNGIDDIFRQGPLLEITLTDDTFASCSIVCEDQPMLSSQ